jgi:hypothetical protein
LASLGNIVDIEVSKGNLSLTGIGAANIINYKAQGILNANSCVCNLINETYPCKRNIAIGRMINNITTATTSKISIARPSYIDNMIGYTSTLKGNVAPISSSALH